MLNSNSIVPMLEGGSPIRSYLCGKHKAVLVINPDSFGPIQYLHFLVVFGENDNDPPIMLITAEQSELSQNVFLCFFNESGHTNLGPSNEYAILENFEVEALAVMRKELDIKKAL